VAEVRADEEVASNVDAAALHIELGRNRLYGRQTELEPSRDERLKNLVRVEEARAIAISRGEGIEHVLQILVQGGVFAEIDGAAVVAVKDLDQLRRSLRPNCLATKDNTSKFRRAYRSRAVLVDTAKPLLQASQFLRRNLIVQ